MFRNANAYDAEIASAIATWEARYRVRIPAWLVKGMIAKESSFNPAATRVEPDGRTSRGLMQVLDGTARDLGITNPRALYTPAVGISVGVQYLARMLQRYRGDLVRAVAAYNRGPGNVPVEGAFAPGRYAETVLQLGRQFAGRVAPALPGLALALGLVVLIARQRRAA